jgi:superfamily II DNA/RNA helicase
MGNIEKVRILVGLNVDQPAYEVIDTGQSQERLGLESHSRTRNRFSEQTLSEMEESEDSYGIEIGIKKFVEFLTTDCLDKEQDKARGGNGKKLEFRAYPDENIHAKVYISRFREDDRDYGRVITGSSNFSGSGLVANREFNVELKSKTDVDFALDQFEALWKDAVDISQEYVDAVRNKTWLRENISPYHLYLKMLYEYLKEDINIDQEIELSLPEGFLDLEYQKQAVVSAKKILDAYNGVFIADVVGLGKTFISALLAQQFDGGKLIVCPPVLKDYWKETFFDFGIRKYDVESIGKLDHILKKNIDKYEYIFIDEAHRFRNEFTQGFEKIHQICFGKKVILVSATPLNNTFEDIYSQLKLFQIPRRSTIPGIPNLDKFFKPLMQRLKQYNKSDPEYLEELTKGSEEIREKILKYVMVRRTRTEISDYFPDDITKQGLFFPDVEDPRRIIYQFDTQISHVFNRTINLLRKFKYSRYMPLLYLKKELSEFEKQSQRNVGGFMKGVLVKRLESSFYAFRKTLDRFVESYENFIDMFEKGIVLISKKVNVYDLLDEDSEERILQLVEEEKVQKYKSKEFRSELMNDLKIDLKLLKQIRDLWADVYTDPKFETFIRKLKTDRELKNKKFIIFTESKETGDYLFKHLNDHFPDEIMSYSSRGGQFSKSWKSSADARTLVRENFDPNHKIKKDEIRILVSTDVLAEGTNLHRSNIVINYDLPWNPTKVLQRVGRVNRVGTKHKNIYIFNFFPTDLSEGQIGLEDNIKSKIQAFHDTLGEDARYLTEEEIPASHELFGDTLYKRLTSKRTYEGEEERKERSELEYLKLIREIRDKRPDLFEQIKRLPKKARSGRKSDIDRDKLITFFRKGKLKKFFITDGNKSQEVNFFDAVDHFQCDEDTKRQKIPKSYYPMLEKNKAGFDFVASGEEFEQISSRGGRSNEQYVISRLKVKEFRKDPRLTDEDEEYIRLVLSAYEDGVIPRNTTKRIKNQIEKENNALKILGILKKNIQYNLLGITRPGKPKEVAKREVILSEFLSGGERK